MLSLLCCSGLGDAPHSSVLQPLPHSSCPARGVYQTTASTSLVPVPVCSPSWEGSSGSRPPLHPPFTCPALGLCLMEPYLINN